MANTGRNDLSMLENGVKKASIISSSSHATWEGAFLNSCLTLLHEWTKVTSSWCEWMVRPAWQGRENAIVWRAFVSHGSWPIKDICAVVTSPLNLCLKSISRKRKKFVALLLVRRWHGDSPELCDNLGGTKGVREVPAVKSSALVTSQPDTITKLTSMLHSIVEPDTIGAKHEGTSSGLREDAVFAIVI